MSRRAKRSLVALAASATAALAVAACGSSNNSNSNSSSSSGTKGLYGSLPTEGTKTSGGTITVSQLTGSTPDFIFPVVPVDDASVYTVDEFMTEMWLPLYIGPEGAEQKIDYHLSLATAPEFSNGDKTVTIHMKEGYKWSNGAPVDANDLIFDIDLIKAAVKESPANWSEFSPGLFPDTLESIKATNKYTVVMKLTKAYNPGYFLNVAMAAEKLFPLPSTDWNIDKAGGPHLNYEEPENATKIYNYLKSLGGKIAEFGTNPLWKDVDGPWSLKSFSATNSSYALVANSSYGGSPKPTLSEVKRETYTGLTPELNALRTGSLDVDLLDFSQLGSVNSLKSEGYSVYGYPNLGFYGAFFNFKDKTDHFNSIISQLYARQALAYLEDQPAYVKGIYKEAAVEAYGPIPSTPPTPYTPTVATKAPYPYDPKKGIELLKEHGWKVVPNGQTVCEKEGSGSEDCGAGIPKGTPFKFSWYYIPPSETAVASLESEAFASEAKKAAGINIELHQKAFNFIISTFNDAEPADVKNENEWGVENFGGFTLDYYPTTSTIFNTGGDYNEGAYSNPEADKRIEESIASADTKAVTNEASFLTENLPILFMPNEDKIWAVSNKIGGPGSSFLAITQYIPLYQYWYLKKS